MGHPGLQEQRQLLGVLQHSNTALYEKPGDLSAEIKPDFSGGFSSNKAEVGTVSVRLDLMVRIRAAVMKLMMNSNYNETEITSDISRGGELRDGDRGVGAIPAV